MPPVILAIAGALEAIGFSVAAATFLAPIVLSLGASMVLGAVSKMFAKGPSSSSLTNQLASRSIVTRSSEK